MKKRPHNSRTYFPLSSHSNPNSFYLDTTVCPGKLKPWKTSGKILVSSWKSEMQPTAEKSDYTSHLVCPRPPKFANSKFKWVGSKILIPYSRGDDSVRK